MTRGYQPNGNSIKNTAPPPRYPSGGPADKESTDLADLKDINQELLSALLAITNSGPDAIPIKEAFEMAHRAIERALTS